MCVAFLITTGCTKTCVVVEHCTALQRLQFLKLPSHRVWKHYTNVLYTSVYVGSKHIFHLL